MRALLLSLVVVVAVAPASSVVLGQAADPLVGVWKQNMANSRGSTVQSRILTVELVDGGLREINDAVLADGRSSHTEIVRKLDGKEYAVPNAQRPNTTDTSRRIDAYAYEWVEKVDGKVTMTTLVVVSRDGKTRTSTSTGRENAVRVYEKP